MKRYRAAVVGGGFIGCVHVEALRRLPNVDVVALCDQQGGPKKAEALGIPAGYSSVEEMLNCEQIDSIHICTPNNTHYDLVKCALERGIHVVCEKPFCTDLAQARELVKLAEQKGLRNLVNLHNRFYPIAEQMREMVSSGQLGKVYSVHGGYLQDWLLYETDFSWRMLKECVGETRAVGDIGSHWIDLVEHVTGLRIKQVMAEFQTVHPVRKRPLEQSNTFKSGNGETEDICIDTEDNALLLFRFENGAIGSGFISQVFAGKKNELTLSVAGEKCSLQWNGENGLNEVWIGSRDRENGLMSKDPIVLAPSSRALSSYPGGHVEGFSDAFKHCFAHFYNSIADPDGSNGYATFKDGLRLMEICHAICESAREGVWVDVPKAGE